MTDEPLDLDKHRGMAAQNATDIRRALAEVENNARDLRERQAILENQLLSVPAASWPEAAAKARYFLNLYASGLPPVDTRHRGSRCGNIRGLCASRSRGLNERDKSPHASERRLTSNTCDVTGELPSQKFMSWDREKQNAVSYPVAVSI